MFRNPLFPSITAALLASATLAAAQTMVKEVEVTADITSIQNPAAATYWTTVADDIENAIVARVTDRTAPDGVRISVDISEVELSNSFQEILNVADTKLVGLVNISSENDNTAFDSYELTVNVDQAAVFLPEGADIAKLTQDSPEYYEAMVNAFAEAVVTKLK